MKGRNRIRAASLAALAATGVVAFTACGANGDKPASTTSPSLSPTSKVTVPGPNNFSPAPIAPLNPTVSPGNGTTAHP